MMQQGKVGFVHNVIRSEPAPPPIIQWFPGFSGDMLLCLYSNDERGSTNCRCLIRIDRPFSGQTFEQHVCAKSDGKIISLKGIPSMFDWEFRPQAREPIHFMQQRRDDHNWLT